MEDILTRITGVLRERRGADPQASYVASLYQKGLDGILQKVGEEATETILAARNAERDAEAAADELTRETADLWFHLLVMLVYLEREPGDVLAELERRFGLSGLAEKAARGETDAGA